MRKIINFFKAIFREIRLLWDGDAFPSLGGAKEMFDHHYCDSVKEKIKK